MRKRFIQMVMLILLCAPLAGADQPKPMPGTDLHDFANVISADNKSQLQEKARQLKEQFKTEIALVTIQSLEGEDQFDYSLKMARDWGIGSPDNEIRGILILIAIQEHKTSFRTSRHIEGELPDGVTGDISRQMNAYFKNNDFGGGLLLGLNKISERLASVYALQEKPQTKPGRNLLWLWVLLGCVTAGGLAFLFIQRSRERARELERKRALTVAETRTNYFAMEKENFRQTGQRTRQNRLKRQEEKQKRKEREREAKKLRQTQNQPSPQSTYTSSSSSYEPSSSSSSGSDYNSYNDYNSSSSYDSGSSSDSGYSGGSDYGGGGSDSSW
jgi:uncharacterized membrane protein YgcG